MSNQEFDKFDATMRKVLSVSHKQLQRFHANVGSRNTALEKRPEILKRVSVYAAIHVLRSVVNNLVRVIGCQSFIGKQRISVESRASFNVLANLCLQGTLAACRNDSSANLSPALQDSE